MQHITNCSIFLQFRFKAYCTFRAYTMWETNINMNSSDSRCFGHFYDVGSIGRIEAIYIYGNTDLFVFIADSDCGTLVWSTIPSK